MYANLMLAKLPRRRPEPKTSAKELVESHRRTVFPATKMARGRGWLTGEAPEPRLFLQPATFSPPRPVMRLTHVFPCQYLAGSLA